jgi:hypothetical protein
MTTAYPLAWPEMFPRTKNRESSRFKTTLPAALENVRKSLGLFGQDSRKGVSEIVLSSNVALGRDKPDDPGIAVWFKWDGLQICIPVDRYRTPAENLQAIHHVIEARRVELRYGTLALVRATMTGFAALPNPDNWRDVLGFREGEPVDSAKVGKAYRDLAAIRHPDRGGDQNAMARLNLARDAALREINRNA